MFSIAELKKIRNLIDIYVSSNDEDAMKIREKLCDLIQIKKAWNSNMHIRCTIADSGKEIDFM